MLIVGTYNIGDFGSRLIPFFDKAVITNHVTLWIATALRCAIMIPLIALMALGIVQSDILAFATVAILCVSVSGRSGTHTH